MGSEAVAIPIEETYKDRGFQLDNARVRWLVEHMETNKLSQADIARQFDISQGHVSSWLKGKYEKTETMDTKVDNLMALTEQRKCITHIDEIPFADTSVSRQILGLLSYCEAQRSLGCITGPPGIGKTRTINEWAKTRNNVILIQAVPVYNRSMNDYLIEIAEGLDIQVIGRGGTLYRAIKKKLALTSKVIIVDEAQHLPYKTAENIRILCDVTKTPFIVAGSDNIKRNLLKNDSEELMQIANRFFNRKHFTNVDVTSDDIVRLFGDPQQEECKFLTKIANSIYGLRSAAIMYVNAVNNGDATIKGLEAAARDLSVIK